MIAMRIVIHPKHISNWAIIALDQIDHTADRKSTRLNSSHSQISYAVFCLKKKPAHSGLHPYDSLSPHQDSNHSNAPRPESHPTQQRPVRVTSPHAAICPPFDTLRRATLTR